MGEKKKLKCNTYGISKVGELESWLFPRVPHYSLKKIPIAIKLELKGKQVAEVGIEEREDKGKKLKGVDLEFRGAMGRAMKGLVDETLVMEHVDASKTSLKKKVGLDAFSLLLWWTGGFAFVSDPFAFCPWDLIEARFQKNRIRGGRAWDESFVRLYGTVILLD